MEAKSLKRDDDTAGTTGAGPFSSLQQAEGWLRKNGFNMLTINLWEKSGKFSVTTISAPAIVGTIKARVVIVREPDIWDFKALPD